MNKILFKETQQFRQWWWIVLVLGSTVPTMLFSIYALYQKTVNGIEVGDNPAPNTMLIVLFFAMIIAIWVFFSMKLEVWIDQEGIHYRFFPLIYKNKILSSEEIQRYEIRKYNAILEYGGWGTKGSFLSRKGKAFNVSGNIGLQLYLTNGKKVLFGTQRSQAIIYAMDEMMKLRKDTRKY